MEGFFLQRYIDSKKMHALILEKCVFFFCKDALCLEKMCVFVAKMHYALKKCMFLRFFVFWVRKRVKNSCLELDLSFYSSLQKRKLENAAGAWFWACISTYAFWFTTHAFWATCVVADLFFIRVSLWKVDGIIAYLNTAAISVLT